MFQRLYRWALGQRRQRRIGEKFAFFYFEMRQFRHGRQKVGKGVIRQNGILAYSEAFHVGHVVSKRLDSLVCQSPAPGNVQMSQASGRNNNSLRQDIRLRLDTLNHPLEGFVRKRVAVLQNQSLQVVPGEKLDHEILVVQASDLRRSEVGKSRARLYHSLQTLRIDLQTPIDVQHL